jgi:hypothetical protein
MITFSKTEPKINSSNIVELEEYVGLTFPIEYKKHLLQYNGGKCSPNIFAFMENGKQNNSILNWFFAISNCEYNNLKEYINTLKIDEKRLPSHILPIADDPGGNLICISCGNNDFGHIYFWDHEKEVDYSVEDDSNYSNLYLISKSFNQFIDELKEE